MTQHRTLTNGMLSFLNVTLPHEWRVVWCDEEKYLRKFYADKHPCCGVKYTQVYVWQNCLKNIKVNK